MPDESETETEIELGFDPWATKNSAAYSVDKIYNQSLDGRGHGESMRVKVPPAVHGQIAALVQKGWIDEYRTMADFLRDAIVHRLKYWSERITDGSLERVVTLAMHQAEIDLLNEQVVTATNFCDSAEDALRISAKSRDVVVMESYLVSVEEALVRMREPYASRLRGLLHEYNLIYKALITGGEGKS